MVVNMTLKEVLKGKNNITIWELEYINGENMVVGGCYYANGIFIQIDGSFFSNCTQILAYDWENANTLKVFRKYDNSNTM